MSSTIERIGKSIIQHDNDNNRVYLMKLHCEDNYNIVNSIENIAREKEYSKIIVKIPLRAKSYFIEKGYSVEAEIPNLYKGKEDGFLASKYLSHERKIMKNKKVIESVLSTAVEKRNGKILGVLPKGFIFRAADESDARHLANFYKNIFKTYPFPIYEDEYVLETMKSNVEYYTIWNDSELITAASCEMDEEMLNVEMTDFGTLPKYRGMGFGTYMLGQMEDKMKERGLKTAYTIARAISNGMNITFSKLGYNFAGTLPNNTNISEGIESMNVWFKGL